MTSKHGETSEGEGGMNADLSHFDDDTVELTYAGWHEAERISRDAYARSEAEALAGMTPHERLIHFAAVASEIFGDDELERFAAAQSR